MPRVSKEDCLMHSPVRNGIHWFDREDIPFKTRHFHFGVWINVTNGNNLKSCCPECSQILSAQQDKMNERGNKKERNFCNQLFNNK